MHEKLPEVGLEEHVEGNLLKMKQDLILEEVLTHIS